MFMVFEEWAVVKVWRGFRLPSAVMEVANPVSITLVADADDDESADSGAVSEISIGFRCF